MKSQYLSLSFAAALAAVAAPAASAQVGDDAKTSPTRQEDAQQKKVFVRKASDITGKEVRNAQGEDVGEIADLVVDPTTGEIQYAVLSIGGFLGMGDKLYGVPWSKLQCADPKAKKKAGAHGDMEGEKKAGQERDAATKDADAYVFVIGLERPQFESAPSFTKEEWPKTDAAWRKQIDTHYGAQQPQQTGRTASMLIRCEDLRGADVHGQDGEEIGELGEIAIDTNEGRIAFFVLEHGGALGIGETHYVLPVGLIQVGFEEDELVVKASQLSQARLENAPKYDDDDWDRMSNPVWLREAYTFWNADPYWSRAVEAGYRKPAPKTDENDEDSDL